MFDLHTHSLLSDGVLLPSEVAVRYAAVGYKAIAICDHVDYSNIENITDSILEFTGHWPKETGITVFPGIELTHLPLSQFAPLAKYARERGIKIIVGHGQTLAEPVIKGANIAALEADIDILAHPGLISEEEVRLSKKRGIFLEVTSRKGHSDTNAHVIEAALKSGARLVLNSDSHRPEDIIAPDQLTGIVEKCGLSHKEINRIFQEVGKFLSKKEGGKE
jgi:putative hydrolase